MPCPGCLGPPVFSISRGTTRNLHLPNSTHNIYIYIYIHMQYVYIQYPYAMCGKAKAILIFHAFQNIWPSVDHFEQRPVESSFALLRHGKNYWSCGHPMLISLVCGVRLCESFCNSKVVRSLFPVSKPNSQAELVRVAVTASACALHETLLYLLAKWQNWFRI